MLRYNRVIYSDNGTLSDLSINLSNPLSGTETVAVVAAEDALYIGSDLPFNHRYITVSTANSSASVASVALWDGEEWNAAVDVVDETSVGGKTLAQSGVISWTPDKDELWTVEDTTEDMGTPLSTLKIYDLYWAKITFSGNLSGSTALKYVGHKFCEGADLYVEYPDLENTDLMTAFKAGKTDWNDQIYLAAEYVIKDIRESGVILSPNQVLDWQRFKSASVHRTAQIIYASFGDDYKDDHDRARASYREAIKIKNYNVDQDKNATLTLRERTQFSDFHSR